MTLPDPHARQSIGSAGRRQAARLRLALPGTVVLVTEHAQCQLDDISQTGASLTIDAAAPPLGRSAMLIVNAVEAFGTVVWRRGPRFGLRFDDPLPKTDVIALRAAHDHFESLDQQRRRRQAQAFVTGRRL
jgi:hypothetical protein